MKWFRSTTALFILGTLVMATALAAVIISMCTNAAHVKHMQSDPNYNGTLGIYIVIILIQFVFITLALYGLFLCYRNWQNNFQLDHSSRHRFVMWLSFWSLISLVDMGVAVFAIVKGKEPQEEMAHLYDLFARTSQDEVFITAFEKYQKDKGCCGVYGPDDWLMVQLRSGMGGGGGGGGFQSLDYGFRQNPSTGHCHLTPPTIPMGCGKKILAEVHFTLSLFSGLLILETIVGLATAGLAGYCFYYWLDKEVIVIPEDEVSNLVILEPESSTSTTESGSRQASRYASPPRGSGGSQGPYLGPPPGDYPRLESQAGSRFSRSRGPSNIGSYRGSVDRRPTEYPRRGSSGFDSYTGPSAMPSARSPGRTVTSMDPNRSVNPAGGGPSSSHPEAVASSKPAEGVTSSRPAEGATSSKPAEVSNSSPPIASYHGQPTTTSAGRQTSTQARLSRAGPFDANSRYESAPNHQGSYAYHVPTQQPFYQPFYPGSQQPFYAGTQHSIYPGSQQPVYTGTQQPMYNGMQQPIQVGSRQPVYTGTQQPIYTGTQQPIQAGSYQPVQIAHQNIPGGSGRIPTKEHSAKHLMHKQEAALGGKVLGEMHVDHAKDDEPMNSKMDATKGTKPHHATIAIVRNKKAPKPRQLLASNDN